MGGKKRGLYSKNGKSMAGPGNAISIAVPFFLLVDKRGRRKSRLTHAKSGPTYRVLEEAARLRVT